ncbi:hypothetical protein BH11MYX4_BH11MYX4_52070 [soil metagenome]
MTQEILPVVAEAGREPAPLVNPTLASRAAFAAALLCGMKPPRSDAFYESDLPFRMPVLLVKLAAQDWLVVVYLAVLLAQCVEGHGPRRAAAIPWVLVDLAVWGCVLMLVRSRMLAQRPRLATVIYRAGIGFPILASFLQLQYILPAVGRPPLDAELYAFDRHVFGVEPAQAWDRFVSPATTEWFAFFYYGYFLLIAIHVLPMLGLVKSSRLLAKFSFGFIWLYCIGQALYTFVPAFGPYAYLAHELQHPLQGAFWWPLVRSAVDSVDGGARTDVFPSLHTALPTYLSLFSFLERKRMPFKLTWAPLTLFTTQIIAATMFLRWHYLIDIGAGIVLAISAVLVSRAALRWDAMRERLGGSAVWIA